MPKKNSERSTVDVYETVPLDTLHLDPANVRKHGKRNLDAIKAALV